MWEAFRSPTFFRKFVYQKMANWAYWKDKPETVKNRLDVNIKMNTPLLDFYKEKGILHEVNGNQDIDKVFADIKAILDQIA